MKLTFIIIPCLHLQCAAIGFNIIEELFTSPNSVFTGSGVYDFYNTTANILGADGIQDLEVVIETEGTGIDSDNAFDWSASVQTTDRGLQSNLSTASIGAAPSTLLNNRGHQVSQSITFNFLNDFSILSNNITNFRWTSGNTSGQLWETSSVEYDLGGGFQITADDHGTYSAPASTGIFGNGFIAADTGVVTDVSLDLTRAGSHGSQNNLRFTNPVEDGILLSGQNVSAIRYIHRLEDVSGVNNEPPLFTSTLRDLELNVTPEPTSS